MIDSITEIKSILDYLSDLKLRILFMFLQANHGFGFFTDAMVMENSTAVVESLEIVVVTMGSLELF